jgi:tRNA nucleotidyltransferase (CCA-adding enzyme)
VKAYIVGGAVRDGLLGQPVNDRDWVVVGATPELLVAQGYRPVGRDFPVFLHPTTHEEVALARTERKTASGYHGFVFHAAPDVTLEQDLARRDLTVNAMALDPDTGAVIDPFGGQRDLQAKVLRHVSPAFAEDPVRLLRLARFAARWGDFDIAPDTQALMVRLVADGEIDALVPERVWQELARGLMERTPSRMFEVLASCGALERLAPGFGGRVEPAVLKRLNAGAQAGLPLPARLAILCRALPDAEAVQQLCDRWRMPGDCRDLALLLAREHGAMESAAGEATVAVALLERCDALRRPERFSLLLQAWQLAADGHTGARPGRPAEVAERLHRALHAARGVSAAALQSREASAAVLEGPALGRALHEARRAAIAHAFTGT